MSRPSVYLRILLGAFIFALSLEIPMPSSSLRLLVFILITAATTYFVADRSKTYYGQMFRVGFLVLVLGFILFIPVVLLKVFISKLF